MLTRCRDCNGINPELSIPIGGTVCDCATNPKSTRIARIAVQVSHDWLTVEGTADPSQGWVDTIQALTSAIQGLSWPLKLEFIEWDGEPEQAA